MIWPRWAAACSSFSINNCVHKNERTGDNKRRRGRSSSRSRQQQRWQRQRSVQAENQLRDSLICMSTPKSSPLVTPPSSHTPSPPLPVFCYIPTTTTWPRTSQRRRRWHQSHSHHVVTSVTASRLTGTVGQLLRVSCRLRKRDNTRGLWNIYIVNNTTATVESPRLCYNL